MKYESPRQFFRDMHKNPDMYPPDHEEKAEIAKMLREEEVKKEHLADESKKGQSENIDNTQAAFGEKRIELKTPSGIAFLESVNLILDAQGPDAATDPQEAKIFTKRKEMALDYLARTLEDAKNYLTQVNALQLVKMSSYEYVSKYQEAVSSGDALRRSFHNKLISDIKIAMKIINLSFSADFPGEMRLQAESMMPERKGISRQDLQQKLNQQQYYQFPFPAGGFIDFSRAPKDPQGEREYIASWALKIYGDFAALSTNIKEALEKKKLPL